jgi:hypothetical protein
MCDGHEHDESEDTRSNLEKLMCMKKPQKMHKNGLTER